MFRIVNFYFKFTLSIDKMYFQSKSTNLLKFPIKFRFEEDLHEYIKYTESHIIDGTHYISCQQIDDDDEYKYIMY